MTLRRGCRMMICGSCRTMITGIGFSTHLTKMLQKTIGTSSSNVPSKGILNNERGINLTNREHLMKLRRKPVSPPDARISRVAIIGAPNAGKSTIANKLLGWRFAAVSGKVHTTRAKTLGILTEGSTQVIFLDTPGMITPPKLKIHSMERSLLTDPHSALYEADLIMVVVDISTPWGSTSLDMEVLKSLHLHSGKASILVLNKVDKLKVKRYLLQATRQLTLGYVGGQCHSLSVKQSNTELDVSHFLKANKSDSSDSETIEVDISSNVSTPLSEKNKLENHENWREYDKKLRKIRYQIDERDLKGWPNFDKVFMLVAKDGDGVWDLKRYLIENAKPGDWEFDGKLVTTQMPKEMAKECIWEKCMDHLAKDIPYKIDIKCELWEFDESGMLRAVFSIICSKSREMKNVIGKDGENIRTIAMEAKQSLMDTFRHDMSLKVYARLRNSK